MSSVITELSLIRLERDTEFKQYVTSASERLLHEVLEVKSGLVRNPKLFEMPEV